MADNKDLTFLGIRMKKLRESHDCTMADMLKKLVAIGYVVSNKSSISRVEAGKMGVETTIEFATKYCQAFGMTEEQTKQFLRGQKIAVPDTSALLRNSQLIDALNSEYGLVVIPKVVMDELDSIKNHRTDSIAKKAWEVIRGISYGEKTILMPYSGENPSLNNDCKIIHIAREASVKYNSKVDIITEDADYSAYLKGDDSITALPLNEYIKTKQTLVNMDRMNYYDSLYLDSYDGIESPNCDEINGYLSDGNTLIISALRYKGATLEQKKKKIKWLIANGADIDKRDCNRRYFPALSHAVQLRNLDMVLFLLKECAADPNVGSRNPHDSGKVRQKNEGNMPLMIAAWTGDEGIVRALCEDERISINQQDANGFTALMKACMNGNRRCRDILLDAGADVRIVDIEGRNYIDHHNRFLENGAERKTYNRGYSNKRRDGNANRNRW